MKRFIFSIATFGLASTGYSYEDRTKDFVDFFNTRFIGLESSYTYKWDNRNCILPKIGGGCSEYSGSEIYGEGHGRVNHLDSQSGRGFVFDIIGNPWDPTAKKVPYSDITLIYRYAGETEGKKQCYPGNFFCGYEWGSLHPEGRIIIDIQSDLGSYFIVKVRYEVIGDNGDKPGRVLVGAMQQLQGKATDIVQTFLWQNGSEVTVTPQSLISSSSVGGSSDGHQKYPLAGVDNIASVVFQE